jgi:hypothetical protein
MTDHEWEPGVWRSGGGDYFPLTVGELRAAIADLPEDVELNFGCLVSGAPLLFYRFKWRGEKRLQIELNEHHRPFLASGPFKPGGEIRRESFDAGTNHSPA